MDTALIEALRQAKLDPGTYRCRVNGHEVVIQVLASSAAELRPHSRKQPSVPLPDPLIIDESCIMLDPWVELPEPSGGIILKAQLGEPDPADIPEIPNEYIQK